MARIFYDVVPSGRDWAVRCHKAALSSHVSKTGAISIAAAVAEGDHSSSGRATGVRVRGDDGAWEVQGVFGADPIAAA
ncbi:MAG TPA: hypothetical protein VFG21_09770 [Xanthomonadaceae bacterium]|nr:hypothetical protein [Xanthomonadaceae bacterium]